MARRRRGLSLGASGCVGTDSLVCGADLCGCDGFLKLVLVEKGKTAQSIVSQDEYGLEKNAHETFKVVSKLISYQTQFSVDECAKEECTSC